MREPFSHEQLWEHAKDLGDEMVDAGANPDAAAEALADFLDRLVPVDVLIPGLPGMFLEAHDDDAFEVAIKAFINLFKGDPDKRAARRAARKHRKQARRAAQESPHGR